MKVETSAIVTGIWFCQYVVDIGREDILLLAEEV